jgi:REP element-mobilizing transposase RayT
MPRKLRIDGEGLWHHVMNRAIDHAPIFDDTTSRLFLIELRDSCSRYGVEVHAYCILPNHYHLLVHTPEAGLSEAMQRLSSRFTQAVNRLRDRDGPLFKGRFRSIAVKDDAHLVQVSRYIHLNPVAAGLTAAADGWGWSSAVAYLGLADKPEWLHISALLEMFATANPAVTYARFLHDSDGGGQTPRTGGAFK